MESNGGTLIGTALARQLVKNYKDGKKGAEKIRTDDTHGAWFSRETLLDTLGVANPTEDPISGIRVYFAAYPTEVINDVPHNEAYLDKLCLVIVQTKDENGKHVEILSEPDARPDYPKFLEYNDGQLCPPPDCPLDGLMQNT